MDSKINSLSKDCWMPDVLATACYKCEKSFNSFRRRHHCRYCGLLFCGNCSKANLKSKNGAILDRACDKCYGILTMPELKSSVETAQYPYFPKDNSVFNEDDADDTKTESNLETNIDLQHFFNEDFEINADVFESGDFGNNEELEKYLKNRCTEVLKLAREGEWVEKLLEVTKEAVRSIKPHKKDAQNLSKYLKIIRFPTEEKCKFFKGIIFKKGLANKKMAEKIKNPKILILSGSTGFFLGDKKIVSMQKLIEQEENYTKIFLELIVNNIQPNIIVIEKAMPFPLLDELSKLGISVILNVKKKNLKLVSRLTSGKILTSINQALYHNGDFLGTCSEFWQQRIGPNLYCFFEAYEESYLCGSILFNPETYNKQQFKDLILKICVQYRSVLLEHSLLSLFDAKSVNYEDFHSAGTLFIHLSTCRGKMCSRPKVHEIEYYSKKGKALGEFVKFYLTKALEKCENFCEKKLFEHKHYFYKSNGRVKISFLRTENKEKTLTVSRLCDICLHQSENKILDSISWKFSFNKFIDNFFRTGHLEHYNCPHDFYKSGKFLFAILNFSMIIEYESVNHYSICKKMPYNDEFLKSLAKYDMERLVESGQRMLLELSPMKSYIFKLSLSEFTEESQVEDAIVLNRSNQSIEESFTKAELVYEDLKTRTCENHLQVAALRRSLFIALCKVIVGLEGAVDILEKMNQRKGQTNASLPSLKTSVSSIQEFICLDSTLTNKFDILTNRDFLYLKEGLLTFPLSASNLCVPVDEDDSLSIIAYALSSEEYFKDIQEEFEDDSEDFLEKIESNLLSSKDDHFVFSQSNYNEEEFHDNPQKESFRKIYGEYISVKVVAYFYKQFHGLREYSIGSHVDYLLSISQSQKEELHLGKSKAYFKNTQDQRFIVKIVGEKQFRMFVDFAPNYFRHNCKNKFHGMPSCLVKIIGAYSINVKNHSTGKSRQEWLFISENLCYDLPKHCLTFDLKGTINRRRKVQEGDERTKMDLNFVEYMNGLPIVLDSEDKKRIDAEIWNDTLFLSQQNIVDYSLLLILDTENFKLNYGIIDYMEQYTFERAIESKYKTVVGSELPTIIYPKEYKNRFRQHFIQVYFMSTD